VRPANMQKVLRPVLWARWTWETVMPRGEFAVLYLSLLIQRDYVTLRVFGQLASNACVEFGLGFGDVAL